MGIFQEPLRASELQLEREPSAVKKPRFPRGLLDEQKFIDPAREAALMVPEQALASSSALLEAAAAAKQTEITVERKKGGAMLALYEYLLSLFRSVKTSLGRRAGRRARLTRRGQEALDQLRHLAQVCDATEARTPEEVLAAEAAFGEAYYEIMSLSANLVKMSQAEESHHVSRYFRNMSRVLRAAD